MGFGPAGPVGSISSMAVLEDIGGEGEAFYIAINFDFRYEDGEVVRGVGKWDGMRWRTVGGGLTSGVTCLTVFDAGSGPRLFAGGEFIILKEGAESGSYVNLAMWDGSVWSAVDGLPKDSVLADLAVFDDGTGGGPALFVAGPFGLAKWTGTDWVYFTKYVDGWITDLCVFDDGSGPALFAGGEFQFIDELEINNIAKWDGKQWSSVGGGVSGDIDCLTVFDDGLGGGPNLVVGGSFDTAGNVSANNIARWDGQSWLALGGGVTGCLIPPCAYGVFDMFGVRDQITDAQVLYVAGRFTHADGSPAPGVARWDGTNWMSVGGGTDGPVGDLAVFDDGDGARLFIGGGFRHAGPLYVTGVAIWDGIKWSGLNTGQALYYSHNGVGHGYAFQVFDDDGPGPRRPGLYVGGIFRFAGDLPVQNLARWDGVSWSDVGGGVDSSIHAMTVFDDGSGPALYVGGFFDFAGGVPASGIAKWDGSKWSNLGSGVEGSVHAMCVYDDGEGDGPQLYVGGEFDTAGGTPALYVARWNGKTWSPLGAGLPNGVDTWTVRAMAVFDDHQPDGPALFVGGSFQGAGGIPLKGIARWNGVAWSPLGAGVNYEVRSIAVYDDQSGSGEALYVAGQFNIVDRQFISSIAKWNGQSWSDVGGAHAFGAAYSVDALETFDDATGSGPVLVAAGRFGWPGSVLNTIARWDGSTWAPLGSGIVWGYYDPADLAVYDDGLGGGDSLFVGGNLSRAGGLPSYGIARWGCPHTQACHADLAGYDGVVNINDLLALVSNWGPCANNCAGPCVGDMNLDCTINTHDLLSIIAAWGPCQ